LANATIEETITATLSLMTPVTTSQGDEEGQGPDRGLEDQAAVRGIVRRIEVAKRLLSTPSLRARRRACGTYQYIHPSR
jgi:hypothetical protein